MNVECRSNVFCLFYIKKMERSESTLRHSLFDILRFCGSLLMQFHTNCCLQPGASFTRALDRLRTPGDIVRYQNRNKRHSDYKYRDNIGYRTLPRPHQFGQHPDRQGCLLPGGKGGNDDLVKAERKRQHPSRQQCRRNIGQNDISKRLESVGPQIH